MPQALDPLPLREVTLVGRVSRHLSHNTRCVAEHPSTSSRSRRTATISNCNYVPSSPGADAINSIAGCSVQQLWGFDGKRFEHEGEKKNKLLKLKLRS